jgi:hypothetical protein
VILPHFIKNVKAVCPGGSEVALASGDRVKLSAANRCCSRIAKTDIPKKREL